MSAIALALTLSTLLQYSNSVTNVTHCPTGCDCHLATSFSGSVTIYCGHIFPDVDAEQVFHQLDSLLSTNNIAKNLTSLRIVHTPLTRIPPSICQLLNLTSLHIQFNRNLTKLPDNCFTNLTKLVTLSLSDNSIDTLHEGLFDGLHTLVTLDLSHNSIVDVHNRSFDGLQSLATLDLSHNSIVRLQDWLFNGLQSLATLDLSYNSISGLQNTLFGVLQRLVALNLSHNSIVGYRTGCLMVFRV